jgi:4'-phosphopantetheinyl transferase
MPMTCSGRTLYPVIMPVPEAHQALRGRDKVQALSRLARVALRRSCEASGLHLSAFPKNDLGVPLPVDGIHWSVSHKSGVVGGVAAPLPVGIDLETLRPVSDGLLAKVADDDEWGRAHGDRQGLFFRFWTAKEAVLKAVGAGIGGLSHCRILDAVDQTRTALIYDGTPWTVVHHWFDGHVAAITSHHFEVAWTFAGL